MKPLAFIVFMVALLSLPISTFPTCIVIVKAPDGNIYIAADNWETKGPTVHRSVCKIHQHGNECYAIAGWAQETQTKIAGASLDGSGEMKHKLEIFKDNLKQELLKQIKKGKMTKEQLKNYLSTDVLSSVAFVYFENKKTHISQVTSLLRKSSSGELFITSTTKEDINSTALGYGDHINQSDPEVQAIEDNHPNDWISYCRELVKLEKRYHSPFIGDTVDIFELTKDGRPFFITANRCPN